MANQIATIEQEYSDKYGNYPDSQTELVSLLESSLRYDKDKLRQEEERIDNLPWNELMIYLPVIPIAAPRPRYHEKTKHFYVKGASTNKKLIQKYLDEYNVIYTNTIFSMETYLPTPISSMTNIEVILAEKGKIGAMITKDWDNLGKTYSDAIQSRLLINDNLITLGAVKKQYSIKPRIIMNIKYQCGFDSKFNERRIKKSIAYLEAEEMPYFTDYTQ